MDDIEALFSVHHINREQLRFFPEEHSGSVSGPLTVIDRDSTGRATEIDCDITRSAAILVQKHGADGIRE